MTFQRTRDCNAAMPNTLQKNSQRPTTGFELPCELWQHLINGIHPCFQFLEFQNHQRLTSDSVMTASLWLSDESRSTFLLVHGTYDTRTASSLNANRDECFWRPCIDEISVCNSRLFFLNDSKQCNLLALQFSSESQRWKTLRLQYYNRFHHNAQQAGGRHLLWYRRQPCHFPFPSEDKFAKHTGFSSLLILKTLTVSSRGHNIQSILWYDWWSEINHPTNVYVASRNLWPLPTVYEC